MKHFAIIFIILFPIISTAQQHVSKNVKQFHPFVSVNYNYHNIQYPEIMSLTPTYGNSAFFGSEFGFSIFPKNRTGFFFTFNNKLVAELGVREIYNLFNSDISNNITDYTLSSGFFGSLDVGKQIKQNNSSQFIAGIRIGDKYIAGINNVLFQSSNMVEYDGFHLAPGIYGELKYKLSKKYSSVIKLALSQSVLNFWSFSDNGNDFEFRHPFFTDLSAQLFHKSGIYLKIENNIVFPGYELKPSFRTSFGIGYRF